MRDNPIRHPLLLAALATTWATTWAASWVGTAAAQAPPPDRAVASTIDSAVGAVLRRAGVAPTEATLRGTEAKSREAAIERLARSYPLPPEMLNSRDQLPENPGAVIDRLGLTQHPGATRTDLSGRTPPTASEIFDALAPR